MTKKRPELVVNCGKLEELGEVVECGEDQHWQDVSDEGTLVMVHGYDDSEDIDEDEDNDINDDAQLIISTACTIGATCITGAVFDY